MIENQDKRKNKAKGWGQAKEKVLKLMASLTLQNVDQACRIQLETGFLLTLRNTEAPECFLPVMFRVSAAWRRAKEADPTSLDRPLRCSLMISLILELVARLERLQSDEALQKQAQELHWLTPDNKWQYRVWNPAAGGDAGALEVDTSRAPVTQENVLENLAQAQKLVLEASNLTRFQVTRPLVEDQSCGVPFGRRSPRTSGAAPQDLERSRRLRMPVVVGRQVEAAAASPSAGGGSSVEVALVGLRLRNPDQQCYVNALALASLCWLGASLTVQVAAQHPFFRDTAHHLLSMHDWRQLCVGWHRPSQQHDVHEYLLHVLAQGPAVEWLSRWRSGAVIAGRLETEDQGASAVPLQMHNFHTLQRF